MGVGVEDVVNFQYAISISVGVTSRFDVFDMFGVVAFGEEDVMVSSREIRPE